MRKHRSAVLLAICLSLTTGCGVTAEPLNSGGAVEDFFLPDSLGAMHSLSEWHDKSAVVIVFLGTECPLAKLYGPRLAELSKKYADQGVQFVGINSNRQDTLREIEHYARVHSIQFPILKDSAHTVADQFSAERTPAAYVLDQERVVRYQGRIDDEYGVGYSRASGATKDYVAAALDELLAGQPVTTRATEAVGCYIGRSERKAPTGDITYTSQISRLVQAHCLRCHREGQIAPFSLASYDDVTAWAETMVEVIDEGRMPPWHANPAHGEFANDAHMTDGKKQLFRQWLENGMPEGDPSKLPPAVEFPDQWQIGTPDVIYRMPQAYTVPAKGVVPYQYFYLDAQFEEDVWVSGAEIRPGNRAVVHHAFVFFLPPGQDEPRAEDPLFNAIAGFAPGMPAGMWPEGHARLVPAGSKLVFQMHYTPNGSEQIDRSEVGLVFTDPNHVTKKVQFAIAVNVDFRIPPGVANYHVPAGYTFTQDTLLHALIPHMHYRGQSFRFTAEYPDGGTEILLDVPRYDFNWQNVYLLKREKLMPEGTVIMCDGRFDNSAGNLTNPDPTQEVRWGDQTWDEMMLGSMVISVPQSSAPAEFPKIVHVENQEYDVTFRLRPKEDQANIERVYLAGSFNDWKPDGHLMSPPDEQGYFRTTIRLTAGYYEYKFVLNGETWTHDPENPEQNGPFTNSVVRVRTQPAD